MSVETQDWIPTSKQLPPEGEVVEAMDSGGHVQDLKRQGRLWFFPDASMYVYYVPSYWRKK
jgi:hypothetical protein